MKRILMMAAAGLFSLAFCLSFTGNHTITKAASQPKVNVKTVAVIATNKNIAINKGLTLDSGSTIKGFKASDEPTKTLPTYTDPVMETTIAEEETPL